MLTVLFVLVVAAFIVCIVTAVRPAWNTLWVAVLLLCIVELLRALPVGR